MTYNDRIGQLLEDVDATESQKYIPDAKCFLRPVVLSGDGRLVIQQDEAKAPSRIIHVAQKNKARPTTGRVIAVSDDTWNYWLGKRVLFGMMSGVAACFKNRPFWLVLNTAEVIAEIMVEDAVIDQDAPLALDAQYS